MASPQRSQSLYLDRFSPKTCEKYLAAFHEIWSNPDNLIWSTKPARKTIDESRELLQSYAEGNPDKYFIILKNEKEDRMIGHIGANKESPEGVEIGYCIHPDHWGKGYATYSLQLFLQTYWNILERKEVKKLVAKIHKDNLASRRVLVKVGAREGEVIPEAYARFIDGGKLSDDYCWYLDRPNEA